MPLYNKYKPKKLNPEVVTQSNDLVDAVQHLSIRAKRVFLMLVAQINPNEQNNSRGLVILVSDYQRLTGSTTHAYEDMKRGASELRKCDIFFREEDITKVRGVIDGYDYETGEARLTAHFCKEIKPHLFNLASKGYSRSVLAELMILKSIHSVRLFESLMKWRKTGVMHISIDQFREIMNTGDKYQPFSELRKYVLEKSVREINSKSNWLVTYTLIKKGRKVTRIDFHIEPKTATSEDEKAREKLEELGQKRMF